MEITEQFENTFDNLDGLRPVISNLLALASQKKTVSKAAAREKIQSIIIHIIDRLNDGLNTLAEENEHQTGLFESMQNLFNDAINRGGKLVAALEGETKSAAKKLGWLKTGVSGAANLAKVARVIVNQRAAECRLTVEAAAKMDVRSSRFLSVIGNLQGVIADRWGSLKGFFIQKMQEESK